VCSGFPVLVKPSEAEKNYAALAEAAGGSALSATNERRVYLGNVAPLLTEGALSFEPWSRVGQRKHTQHTSLSRLTLPSAESLSTPLCPRLQAT